MTFHAGTQQIGVSGTVSDTRFEVNLLKNDIPVGPQVHVGAETSVSLFGANKYVAWDFDGDNVATYEFTLFKITDKAEFHFMYQGMREVFETSLVKYDVTVSRLSLAHLKIYTDEGIEEMELVTTTFGGEDPPDNSVSKAVADETKKHLQKVDIYLKGVFGTNCFAMGSVWGVIASLSMLLFTCIVFMIPLFPQHIRVSKYWFIVTCTKWSMFLMSVAIAICNCFGYLYFFYLVDHIAYGNSAHSIFLVVSEERLTTTTKLLRWLTTFGVTWAFVCVLAEKAREKWAEFYANKWKKKSKQQPEKEVDIAVELMAANEKQALLFQKEYSGLVKLLVQERGKQDKKYLDILQKIAVDASNQNKPVKDFFDNLEKLSKVQGKNVKWVFDILKEAGYTKGTKASSQ